MENTTSIRAKKPKSLKLAYDCLMCYRGLIGKDAYKAMRILLKAGFVIEINYDPEHEKVISLKQIPRIGPEVREINNPKFLKIIQLK